MESPTDIPGLKYFGDAADPSTILMSADNLGFVHTWLDKSENGNDLVQTNPNLRPRTNVNTVKEKKMDQIDISKVVLSHEKWAYGEEGGERANLKDADLRGARLVEVDLRRANLSGVNLKGADLKGIDLSGADLSDANLRGADLKEAKICYASLSGATLRGVNLIYADLSGADLSGADLWGANLSGANLKGANLSGANLKGANLKDANLSGANLWGADMGRSNLLEANLPETVKVFNLFMKIKTVLEDGGTLKVGDYRQDEKTHSLAGWVTTLAGEGGRVAENLLGASCAAVLIINESCPYLEGEMPDFYDNNVFSNSDEMIMKFINECAEKEKVGFDG